jgi:DNA-binding response OmpR family regulator
VTDRAIDVFILRLRYKIEADPTNPLFIKSVRGFGYRFWQASQPARQPGSPTESNV